MDWTNEQSDWLIHTRDCIEALVQTLLASSAFISYEGVRALRQIPRQQRKFLKVPSPGLAAYHAGQAASLGEVAVRTLRAKTPAHDALDKLRCAIRRMPQGETRQAAP